MGYSYGTVAWLAGFERGLGTNILDLGSQDIFLGSANEIDAVNAFVKERGGEPLTSDKFPCEIPAAELWRRCGYSYQCVDIDERPGTLRIDLQSPVFPESAKGRFDLVVNGGTTEHLANPIGGFTFMHYACRTGGIMAHDVPLSGYSNHALVNPTLRFWQLMIRANGYEVISAAVREAAETPGEGTYFSADFDFIEGASKMQNLSWMISIALRKRSARAFVPPFDYPGWVPPPSAASLIEGAMYPYRRLWTDTEMLDGIEYAMRDLRDGHFRAALPGRIAKAMQAIGLLR